MKIRLVFILFFGLLGSAILLSDKTAAHLGKKPATPALRETKR